MKRCLFVVGCLTLAACQKSAKVDDNSLPAVAAVRGEESPAAPAPSVPGVEGNASNLAMETAQNYQSSLDRAKATAATANRVIDRSNGAAQNTGE